MWEYQYPIFSHHQRLPTPSSQQPKSANIITKSTCQSHLSTPAPHKPTASDFSLNYSARHVYYYTSKISAPPSWPSASIPQKIVPSLLPSELTAPLMCLFFSLYLRVLLPLLRFTFCFKGEEKPLF